jgi:hypothetical protein
MASLLFGLVAGSGLTWAFMSLRRDHYRHEYSTRRYANDEITLAQWEAMRTPFTEGPTQRGNGNGGPTMPKPEINSKPQPAGGRLIGADGVPTMPKPQFPPPQLIREDFLP